MAETQTITQKIQELFAYRRIPELLKLAGIENDSPFVSRLYALQNAIYKLDQYLESNWKIRKKDLKPYWKDIYEALGGFDVQKKDLKKYTKNIERYEILELELRKKKIPAGYSMDALYSCKSCDVKLMRKLIYRHAPGLKSKLREKEWKYYDLITEVNDDVQDVFEDCENWNGNRFLLSLLRIGKGKTRKVYKNFLDRTGKEAGKHFKKHKKDPYRQQLYKWTTERLQETEILLRSTMDSQKLDLVEHSAIAGKIGH